MSLLRSLRYRFERWRTQRFERAPYRFLVRRWDDVSDFELLVAAAGQDWYRAHLVPEELPLDRWKRVVVLAPHQDDETIGCGGTMLRMRAVGCEVTILLVTDGAQVWRDEPDADVVAVRDAELERVAGIVGATVERVGVSNVDPAPTAADIERIAGVLRSTQAELVLTPWMLDRPVKHRMVNHLLYLALGRAGLAAREVWGYQVHGEVFANGFVDITAVAGAKRDLLESFASQNSRDVPYGHVAMGAAAWNARLVPNAGARGGAPLFEVFNALPVSEFRESVDSLYLADLDRVYGVGELARRMGCLS